MLDFGHKGCRGLLIETEAQEPWLNKKSELHEICSGRYSPS